MTYLFCAYRKWTLELFKNLNKKNKKFVLLKNPKQLSYNYVKKLNPKFIFFPDWSWIVPKEIIENYKCVCIHESDLPRFRGGSPIQNQIIRNKRKTKSTAFLMTDKLDAGDILIQKSLSLEGSLNEIFKRMIKNDYQIIRLIIDDKFKRKKQKGKATLYKRRKPEESKLKTLNYSKTYLYNFIRMLEDPYPNAFLKIGKRKIIFKSVKWLGSRLECEVEIE